jgi:hypothetical protein
MAWEATILEDSPRAADWQHVFGARTIPILRPLPQPANLPGFAGAVEVYLIDIAALDSATRARLITHLAERFALNVADVARDLGAVGCPILAKDVAVPIPLRFLAGDDDVDDDDDFYDEDADDEDDDGYEDDEADDEDLSEEAAADFEMDRRRDADSDE